MSWSAPAASVRASRSTSRAAGRAVLLLDRAAAASETTAMAAGIAMQVHPTEAASRLALDSLALVEGLQETTGRRLDYQQAGSIKVARTAAHAAIVHDEIAFGRRLGVAIDPLTAAEGRGAGAVAASRRRDRHLDRPPRPALRARRPAADLPRGGSRARRRGRRGDDRHRAAHRRRRRHRRRDDGGPDRCADRRDRGRRLVGRARGGGRLPRAGGARPARAVRDRADRRHRGGHAARARHGRQRLRAPVSRRPDVRGLRDRADRGARRRVRPRSAAAPRIAILRARRTRRGRARRHPGAAPARPPSRCGRVSRPCRPTAPSSSTRCPAPPGAFVVAGDNVMGLHVSPAVGELLAGWIVGGERPARLAPFGLERFAGRDAAELHAAALAQYATKYQHLDEAVRPMTSDPRERHLVRYLGRLRAVRGGPRRGHVAGDDRGPPAARLLVRPDLLDARPPAPPRDGRRARRARHRRASRLADALRAGAGAGRPPRRRSRPRR